MKIDNYKLNFGVKIEHKSKIGKKQMILDTLINDDTYIYKIDKNKSY